MDLNVRDQESLVTRIAAFVLGLSFVIVPFVSAFFYENQRHELAVASIIFLLFLLGNKMVESTEGVS